mgnify:CR=1 FL=1
MTLYAGAKYLISSHRIAIPRHEIVISCHDTVVSSDITFAGAGCKDYKHYCGKVVRAL